MCIQRRLSLKVVQAGQKGDDEKRHEWVFTLYDFDGKGTPNKEVLYCFHFRGIA